MDSTQMFAEALDAAEQGFFKNALMWAALAQAYDVNVITTQLQQIIELGNES